MVPLRLSYSSFLVLALLAQFLVLDEVRADDVKVHRTQSNHNARSIIQARSLTGDPDADEFDRHYNNIDTYNTVVTPTEPPTFSPTNAPTDGPSNEPSREPSSEPSLEPSVEPSNQPIDPLSTLSTEENLSTGTSIQPKTAALVSVSCVVGVLLTATGVYYNKIRGRGQETQGVNDGNGGYTDIEGGSTS